MTNDEYTRVALDENEEDNDPIGKGGDESEYEARYSLKNCLGMFAVVAGIFAIGFIVGGTWAGVSRGVRVKTNANGLLSPQSFIPESLFPLELSLQGS